MVKMAGTFLVQRLKSPYITEWQKKVGHVFGGESKIDMATEGFEVLGKIFSFDYMGSAEFEFGTIPMCLSRLIKDQEQLISFKITLQPEDILPNCEEQTAQRELRRKQLEESRAQGKRVLRSKKFIPNIEPKTLFVLCRKSHMEEIKNRIKALAMNKVDTKEPHNIPQALNPVDDYDTRAKGWLELDNGWFAFIDKEMWEKTVELFTGSKPQEQQDAKAT